MAVSALGTDISSDPRWPGGAEVNLCQLFPCKLKIEFEFNREFGTDFLEQGELQIILNLAHAN